MLKTAAGGKGLRELDEIAHVIFHLVSHQLEQLSNKHGAAAFSAVELAHILQPYLLCDPVPAHELLRTPERCNDCVRKLVEEATSARSKGASRIYWDPFVEFLSASSRRHTLREGLRGKSAYRFNGQMVDSGDNIRQYAVVPQTTGTTLGAGGGFVMIRDDVSRRVAEWVDHQWAVIPSMTSHLQSAVSGMATSVAYVPAPYHKAVISFASSLGASLGFFDRNAEGKLSIEVLTMTHQTAMKYMPAHGKILCGSALGELSIFTPAGRIGPTVVQPHNGPVVFLGHLTIADAFLSGGSEGRLALVDAGTMTEIRRVDAIEGHICCAALCTPHNIVAVAGSDPAPLLWNASLPPYSTATFLSDGRNSHRHNIVDVSANEHAVMSLDSSGLCKVWDLRTLKCVGTHQPSIADTVKRTTTFSRMFPVPPCGDSREGGYVIAGTAGGFVLAASATSSVEVYVPLADVAPVEHMDVLSGRYLVALSSKSVRFWSTRTGELEGSVELAHGGVPTSLCVCDQSGFVFVGFESGTVLGVSPSAVIRDDGDASVTWTAAEVGARVIAMVRLGSMLLIGTSEATNFVPLLPVEGRTTITPPIVVAGMEGFCTYERFASEANVAIVSSSRRLFVVEASESGDAVEDFREYNLNASLRSPCDETRSVPFCFFGSPSAVCVGDGTDMSIVSLTSAKARRVLSFPSVGGNCVSCSFDLSNGKAVLITLEDDGTCAVFLVTDLLPEVKKRLDKGFLSDQYAPMLHCSFVCAGSRHSSILRNISSCYFSNDNCRCTLYRVDGVRIGDLDMNAAPGATWLSLVGKTRRGSHIVFRATTEAMDGEHSGLHLPVRTVGLPKRSTAAAVQSIIDPLDRGAEKSVPFASRVAEITRTAPPVHTKRITAVRGERSGRTLEPLDLATTRWTTDAPEVKPTRDNAKLLTEMRLFTQGLKPGRSPSPFQGPPPHQVDAMRSPTKRLGKLSPLIPLGATFYSAGSPGTMSSSVLELRSSPFTALF